uniref:Uncharacterized protein n=1 Tax=Arundo donax TaxID=35708 RepID=A0A0A9A010_ARUDO
MARFGSSLEEKGDKS